jgi:hypothetical protein
MIERLVAYADAQRTKAVVYVAAKNVTRFKRLLDADDQVKEYDTHPVDHESRLMTG